MPSAGQSLSLLRHREVICQKAIILMTMGFPYFPESVVKIIATMFAVLRY